MTKRTVTLASRAHTAIRLQEPYQDPEHPGAQHAPPRSFVVNGATHESSKGTGVGVTSGVDAEAWEAWKAANPEHDLVANALIEEVPDGYEPGGHNEFGFEPGLKKAAAAATAKREAEAKGNDAEEEPAPQPHPDAAQGQHVDMQLHSAHIEGTTNVDENDANAEHRA